MVFMHVNPPTPPSAPVAHAGAPPVALSLQLLSVAAAQARVALKMVLRSMSESLMVAPKLTPVNHTRARSARLFAPDVDARRPSLNAARHLGAANDAAIGFQERLMRFLVHFLLRGTRISLSRGIHAFFLIAADG